MVPAAKCVQVFRSVVAAGAAGLDVVRVIRWWAAAHIARSLRELLRDELILNALLLIQWLHCVPT